MTSFLGLNFLNPLFSSFIQFRLVEYLIIRILVIHFIRTYCETPYKIKKNVRHMTSFLTPTRFSDLNQNVVSVPMSPNVSISPKFFGKKLPAILGPCMKLSINDKQTTCYRYETCDKKCYDLNIIV